MITEIQTKHTENQIRDKQVADLSDNLGHNQSQAVSQPRNIEWEREGEHGEEHSAGDIKWCYKGFKDFIALDDYCSIFLLNDPCLGVAS